MNFFSDMIEVQLTSEMKGHFVHTSDAFSPDDNWIVYDTRNNDTHIGITEGIEMVNVETKEIVRLYSAKNPTAYGPGVGAVSFNPKKNQVIFIHGLQNSNKEKPYGFTRRTGVTIRTEAPQEPIFLDARDVTEPFTPGALRGGTHAHSWSPDGEWVSFTYNDDIMNNLSAQPNSNIKDLRMIGVMAPLEAVEVDDDNSGENINGEMFSVVVTEVFENPEPESNQIDRAYADGWIGTSGYIKSNGHEQKRAIAFLGDTRNSQGEKLTELFVVDVPDNIQKSIQNKPIEGTGLTRPNPPFGTNQRRLTFTSDRKYPGVFWAGNPVRSSPNGSLLFFMMKDDNGAVQIFSISPQGGEITQLTQSRFSIDTTFDISPNGRYLVYGIKNSIVITDIKDKKSIMIPSKVKNDQNRLKRIQWSNNGKMIAYNRKVSVNGVSHFQLFVLKNKMD